MSSYDLTKEYNLHFRQRMNLSFLSLVFEKTVYGKVEYICIYSPEKKTFSGYLSKKGLQQCSDLGKKKILSNALWKEHLNRIEEYFPLVDQIETYPIPNFSTEKFTTWWERVQLLTKVICDIYFYCEEPPLQYIETLSQEGNVVHEILSYIGHFKLRAHKRLSILELAFERLLEKISIEKNIPLEDLQLLTFSELNRYLNHQLDSNYLEDVSKRKKGYTYTKQWSVHDTLVYNEWAQVLFPKKETRTVSGRVACNAKKIVRGKVHIHLSFSTASEMPKDCILVTGMTNPQLVPFLGNVQAIVTDEGGLMCHAAIISRELNIPSIVGTQDATQIFKDGDEVEVNTETGTVTFISQYT